MTLNALPKGLAELETMVKGGEPGEPGGSALGALGALVKGGGPYIGPKGGKWADPEHTISWKEGMEQLSERERAHAKPEDAEMLGALGRALNRMNEQREQVESEFLKQDERVHQLSEEIRSLKPKGLMGKISPEYKRVKKQLSDAWDLRNRLHSKLNRMDWAEDKIRRNLAEKKRNEKKPSSRQTAAGGGGEKDKPGGSALGALDALVKGGGPYIGPKGGKWADPQHTISWDEKIHGAGKKQGDLFGEGKKKPTPEKKGPDMRGIGYRHLSDKELRQGVKDKEADRKSAESAGETEKAKAYQQIRDFLQEELDRRAEGGRAEGGGEGGGGKSPEKKLPEIASSLAERATKEAMEAAAKHGSGVQVNDPFHRKAMIEAHRHAEAAHRNAAKVHTRQGNAEAAAEHTRQEKAHGGMAKDHEEGLRRAEKEAAEKEKADQEARDTAERPARYKSALEMADKAGKAAIDATAAFVQTGEEESVEKRDQLAAGHRKAEAAHRLAAHETSDLHTREQHHKEADYHKTVALHHDKWARKNEKTRAAYEKHAAAASQAGDDYQRAVDRGDPAHVLGKMARKAAKHHQDSAIAAEPFGNPKIEGAHDKYRMHYQKLADGHEGEATKSLPALSALSELTKSKPIPLPTSGKAASIASMRASQGVDSQGNAKKGGEIPGGLAEGKKPADFPAEALAAGTKVEMEHTKDPRVAEEIAMDHLTEDPSYYTKLARMESGKKPAAAAKPKSKADRALLKLLEKNPNPKDAKVHALAVRLGMTPDKLEERAYALLADAQKEKSMGTQEMKKGALAALATLTGSDPLEKSMGEDSLYSRDLLSRYGMEAGKAIQTARDWASGFWCSRPAGVALRARAFRVAERLADMAQEGAQLQAQRKRVEVNYENETPAQREARMKQENGQWDALRARMEPILQEARECDRELLRIRSLEAQQEAGEQQAQKAMPAWDDLQKSFYESKDVLEWAGRYWDVKFQARAAELAKKLLAYRQKRAKGNQDLKPMATSSKPDEEDKIIREMHALEIEWLEAEKKKAEKREKVEAASKGLPLEDYRLTPGVDCTHQPHLAVAHAQAVLDSRVRALRDQGVQVGRPGPAPTSRMQKGEDGQIVRLGQSTVLTGGQSDQQAARLADAGRLGAPAEAIPIDRAAGTQVVACPACQGALLKALTVCPHCGVDQHAPRAPREAPATRPALAVRDGQPRLRPAVAETVTLADLQGRGNG